MPSAAQFVPAAPWSASARLPLFHHPDFPEWGRHSESACAPGQVNVPAANYFRQPLSRLWATAAADFLRVWRSLRRAKDARPAAAMPRAKESPALFLTVARQAKASRLAKFQPAEFRLQPALACGSRPASRWATDSVFPKA